MKLSSFRVLRPITFFIILSFIMLLLIPGLLIPLWTNKANRIETEAKLNSDKVHQGILSGLENTAKLLSPMNHSLAYLQRFLSSSLNTSDPPFSAIKTEVAPTLFLALSTIPHLSQISYIALDGLFFSYYIEGDQPFAVYSNTSTSASLRATANNYTWYAQPVSHDTGKLCGEAMRTSPLFVFNASWFQEVLKSTNGYSSVGTGWSTDQKPLLLRTVSIDQRGAVSLGFPVKLFTDFFLTDIDIYGGLLYLVANNGTVLTQGIPNTQIITAGNLLSIQLLNPKGDLIGKVGDVTCQPSDGSLRASVFEIWKTKYLFYCSPLEIIGVKLVYLLALPYEGLESFLHQNIKFGLVLLILLIVAMALSIFTFIFSAARAARREMYLCAALIKQLEATQQAERKSTNKSLAFARASHDVRASLAVIIGSLRLCSKKVAPGSDLQENLTQAETCTEDLLGMLNSILDTSKIEAGKTQLEEEEFDLEQLLEDVVDLYYPAGMKKGVDVVLDPCDGSVVRFSHVKGDRGKLKQILWNLLSNAVKFTSEGHVLVRAWVKKPSFENEILAMNHKNKIRCMSCLLKQTSNNTYKGLDVVNNVQQDPHCMEFIFEVSDTGRGIPKEKQKMVFENYVQVKETAFGQEGTGLGLGIVQSLVRVMGGEIAIVEKEQGDKGTCFRFNTFFSLCGNGTDVRANDHDIESQCQLSSNFHQQPGQSCHIHSPKVEGSQVLLVISSDERSKILQKFMESLGINVSVVKQCEHLPQTLKRIKQKLISSHLNSSQKRVVSRTDRLSRGMSSNSSSRSKDMPLSAFDGKDVEPYLEKKISTKSTLNFVLIVIDTSAGPFREITRAVAEFRRDLCSTCSRIVWIDRSGADRISVQGLEEDKLPPMDLIIFKPLHGSRLYQVIGLLPEFGGTTPATKVREENKCQSGTVPAESSSSNCGAHAQFKSRHPSTPTTEIQEIGSSKGVKPLHGKKVLVVEDNKVLRKIAALFVSELGADIHCCNNGEEALEIVCKKLSDRRKSGVQQSLPFDYILMDCEMEGMDGYEATRRVREEEKNYGVHTPIIALTAHTQSEEKNKMIEAGMDYYLSKPLSKEQLLDAIFRIHGK